MADSTKHSDSLEPVATNSISDTTYLEAQEDFAGRGMDYRMHIDRVDYSNAEFTEFDYALLRDIGHGKPSDTPMADQLLGLEMIVRRIEEAKAKASTAASTDNATLSNLEGGDGG